MNTLNTNNKPGKVILTSARSFMKRGMALVLLALLIPQPGHACAVCMGDPNSAISHAINYAVLVLVGAVGMVGAAFLCFVFYLIKCEKEGRNA